MHVGEPVERADDLRLTLIPAGLDRGPAGWEFRIHGLGTRLGHIRLKSGEKRCEMVRYVLREDRQETQCPHGFRPESLRLHLPAVPVGRAGLTHSVACSASLPPLLTGRPFAVSLRHLRRRNRATES